MRCLIWRIVDDKDLILRRLSVDFAAELGEDARALWREHPLSLYLALYCWRFLIKIDIEFNLSSIGIDNHRCLSLILSSYADNKISV